MTDAELDGDVDFVRRYLADEERRRALAEGDGNERYILHLMQVISELANQRPL